MTTVLARDYNSPAAEDMLVFKIGDSRFSCSAQESLPRPSRLLVRTCWGLLGECEMLRVYGCFTACAIRRDMRGGLRLVNERRKLGGVDTDEIDQIASQTPRPPLNCCRHNGARPIGPDQTVKCAVLCHTVNPSDLAPKRELSERMSPRYGYEGVHPPR